MHKEWVILIINLIVVVGGFVRSEIKQEKRFSILETQMRFILQRYNKDDTK